MMHGKKRIMLDDKAQLVGTRPFEFGSYHILVGTTQLLAQIPLYGVETLVICVQLTYIVVCTYMYNPYNGWYKYHNGGHNTRYAGHKAYYGLYKPIYVGCKHNLCLQNTNAFASNIFMLGTNLNMSGSITLIGKRSY